MGLSRKRQRELKRLKRSAEELWDEQREAIEHASAVLRDARRQASNYAREEVGPRVRDAYEDNVRPAFETGFRAARRGASAARERFSDDVLPAISGAVGSALAMLEAAKDPRVRDVVKRVSRAGQRVGIVDPPKSAGTRPLHPDRPRGRRLRRHRLCRLADPARRRRPVDRGRRRRRPRRRRRGGRRILMLARAAAVGAVSASAAHRLLDAGRIRAERLAVALRVVEPERRSARTGLRRCRPARVHHRRARHLPARDRSRLAPPSTGPSTPTPSTPRSTAARGTSRACSTAQRFVVTFVAEQTIDSTRARPRRGRAGRNGSHSTSELYFGPDDDDLMKLEGSDRPTPIYNDPDDFTPRLVRDGLARLDDATITVDSLSNEPREGGEWLTISGTADVAYRLSDEEAIASLVEQGYSQDEAEGFESLADGEEGHYLTTARPGATRSSASGRLADPRLRPELGVDHRGCLAGLSRPARHHSPS